MKTLFPDHMKIAAQVLDLRLKRQNVVASNLANMKTPGYKARRFEFEEQLQDAVAKSGKGGLTRTDDKHLPVPAAATNMKGEMHKEIAGEVVQGLDSVDLDKEMAVMAKNTMLYNALATVLHNNFTGMKDIITKGER